ncbi:MAG: PIN domain-containing protein [Streptosporangiales bacterium]|nr:PIN domain-containing protein [Streptosporangiales bacterium]
MAVLDSTAVTALGTDVRSVMARYRTLKRRGQWRAPVVPSVVLVECLRGHPGRDAQVNQLLVACDVVESLPKALARRAAQLRAAARRGSAVDALVVAYAELRDAKVITGDLEDLRTLAEHANGVTVVPIGSADAGS